MARTFCARAVPTLRTRKVMRIRSPGFTSSSHPATNAVSSPAKEGTDGIFSVTGSKANSATSNEQTEPRAMTWALSSTTASMRARYTTSIDDPGARRATIVAGRYQRLMSDTGGAQVADPRAGPHVVLAHRQERITS